MTIIQVETWQQFYPDCLPLMAEHHEEIVEDKERMPLDLDVDSCAAMDKAGNMLLLAARKEGKLVGYGIFLLSNSLMSKKVQCATQAPYFVKADERKNGIGLKIYRNAIEILRNRGVKQLFPHHWLKGGGEKLGEFFVHLGAHEIQHEYSLWIGR
jgi:hypothetical protein